MIEGLKSCPFCGTEKYLNVVEFTDTEYIPQLVRSWVLCQNCSAHGPAKECRSAAIDGWNARAGE